MSVRELELFAKWLQKKEYLVRRSSDEVVSEYTSNSQPEEEAQDVQHNEGQKNICTYCCGSGYTNYWINYKKVECFYCNGEGQID